MTIEVVDERERVLATGRFSTDNAGYVAMRRHVAAWPERVWAVEGRTAPAGRWRSGCFWQWSPQLGSRPVPPDVKKAIGAGDARGRNAFNLEAQQARVAPCADAVRLQEAGLTRTHIGQQLGIGPDSVKTLLRDGKFYAHPASDEPRKALARSAAEARNQRMTRAQFEAEAKITKPKAEEAWRDAAILFEVGSDGETGCDRRR